MSELVEKNTSANPVEGEELTHQLSKRNINRVTLSPSASDRKKRRTEGRHPGMIPDLGGDDSDTVTSPLDFGENHNQHNSPSYNFSQSQPQSQVNDNDTVSGFTASQASQFKNLLLFSQETQDEEHAQCDARPSQLSDGLMTFNGPPSSSPSSTSKKVTPLATKTKITAPSSLSQLSSGDPVTPRKSGYGDNKALSDVADYLLQSVQSEKTPEGVGSQSILSQEFNKMYAQSSGVHVSFSQSSMNHHMLMLPVKDGESDDTCSKNKLTRHDSVQTTKSQMEGILKRSLSVQSSSSVTSILKRCNSVNSTQSFPNHPFSQSQSKNNISDSPSSESDEEQTISGKNKSRVKTEMYNPQEPPPLTQLESSSSTTSSNSSEHKQKTPCCAKTEPFNSQESLPLTQEELPSSNTSNNSTGEVKNTVKTENCIETEASKSQESLPLTQMEIEIPQHFNTNRGGFSGKDIAKVSHEIAVARPSSVGQSCTDEKMKESDSSTSTLEKTCAPVVKQRNNSHKEEEKDSCHSDEEEEEDTQEDTQEQMKRLEKSGALSEVAGSQSLLSQELFVLGNPDSMKSCFNQFTSTSSLPNSISKHASLPRKRKPWRTLPKKRRVVVLPSSSQYSVSPTTKGEKVVSNTSSNKSRNLKSEFEHETKLSSPVTIPSFKRRNPCELIIDAALVLENIGNISAENTPKVKNRRKKPTNPSPQSAKSDTLPQQRKREYLTAESSTDAAKAADLLSKHVMNNPEKSKELLLRMALVRENPRVPKQDPDAGTIICEGFFWGQYPSLENVLKRNMKEYYEKSTKKRQSKDQQQFNNKLVYLVRKEADAMGWTFDKKDFCFSYHLTDTYDECATNTNTGAGERKLRDRIRCFFKTHIQNSKKRLKTMLSNPTKKANVKALIKHMDLMDEMNVSLDSSNDKTDNNKSTTTSSNSNSSSEKVEKTSSKSKRKACSSSDESSVESGVKTTQPRSSTKRIKTEKKSSSVTSNADSSRNNNGQEKEEEEENFCLSQHDAAQQVLALGFASLSQDTQVKTQVGA